MRRKRKENSIFGMVIWFPSADSLLQSNPIFMSHLLCVYTFPLCVTPKDISVVTTGWTFFFLYFSKLSWWNSVFVSKKNRRPKGGWRGEEMFYYIPPPLFYHLLLKKKSPADTSAIIKKADSVFFSVTGFLFLLLAVLLNIQKIKNIRVCFLLFKFFNSDLVYINMKWHKFEGHLWNFLYFFRCFCCCCSFTFSSFPPLHLPFQVKKDRNSEAGGQPSSFFLYFEHFSCVSAILFRYFFWY